jgi:hypothetical protein
LQLLKQKESRIFFIGIIKITKDDYDSLEKGMAIVDMFYASKM